MLAKVIIYFHIGSTVVKALDSCDRGRKIEPISLQDSKIKGCLIQNIIHKPNITIVL